MIKTYSWFNTTKRSHYFFEEKELLNNQRMAGDHCINVEVSYIGKKQAVKGASDALRNRILKSVTTAAK